ncbi:hypothetical protein M422DRAFT_254974 [Sphaerobolus stellatus SS14]|uniref:Uncharacterized protein n=1 Tax=Sphaerobolus stellatus (strain SS14) TaxID=990650 RepID=A0A0C9VUL5_SPHS4|nr:hypothetical protein M422DRAFT_254974 [Sphaerobolus stellatus SS14]
MGGIIESAAIYTTWTIFYFAAYCTESNIQFLVIDSWPAISGISAMFINVRVGLGWAAKLASTNPSSVNSQRGRENGRLDGAYKMRPLTVNITRVTDKDDGEVAFEDIDYAETNGTHGDGKTIEV